MIEFAEEIGLYPKLRIDKHDIYFGDYRDLLEGQEWAKQQVINEECKFYIVFGIGWGWHIASLLKLLAADCRVLLVEARDMPVAKLQKNKLSAYLKIFSWLEDRRVEILEQNAQEFKNSWKKSFTKVRILRFWPLVEKMGNFFADWEFAVMKLADYKYNRDYSYRMAVRNSNFEHFWSNLSLFGKSVRSNHLRDLCYGKPVFCISSGPALDDCIDLVKKYSGKAILIAAGSAIAALQKNQIVPDVVVVVDTFSINDNEIIPYLSVQSILAVPTTVSPQIVSSHKGNLLFFDLVGQSPECQLIDAWLEYFPNMVKLHGSVSVSITAVSLAIAMGGRDIILFGQNLAFSGERHHSSLIEANISVHAVSDEIWLDSQVVGEKVRSKTIWAAIKQGLENFPVLYGKIKFYNISPGGAAIVGYENLNLSSLAMIATKNCGSKKAVISHSENKNNEWENIQRYLLEELKPLLAKAVVDWQALYTDMLNNNTTNLSEERFIVLWQLLQAGCLYKYIKPLIMMVDELLINLRYDRYSQVTMCLFVLDSLQKLVSAIDHVTRYHTRDNE